MAVKVIAQPMDFSFGIFFQPGISDRIISYQDGEIEEGFPVIHDNEKPDIGWEGGITSQIYLSEFIHIEPGITVSKKGFRSIFTTDDLVLAEENEDPMIAGLEKSIASREYYFVSVPLRAGATIYQDRTFLAGVRTGISFDYHFRSTVRYEKIYYDRTENSVEHPEIDNFRKINISGSLSIFGSYALSDQYDVSLEPFCSVSILSTTPNTEMKSRFILGGIRASIHYKF
jgi:hypothetical protein